MSLPLRVLLVEDNEDDVVFLAEACAEVGGLKLLGCAADGEEALAWLRQRRQSGQDLPDLALVDLNMPRMDGFEFLLALRRDEALAPLPVVVLTTSSRASDVQQAYRLGAACYLRKPVGLESLTEQLRVFTAFWAGHATLPEW